MRVPMNQCPTCKEMISRLGAEALPLGYYSDTRETDTWAWNNEQTQCKVARKAEDEKMEMKSAGRCED